MRYLLLSIVAILLLFMVFSILWAVADYMSTGDKQAITYTGAAHISTYEYAENRTTLSDIYEDYKQKQIDKDNYEQIKVETARTRDENLRIVSYSS